jgi:hypothetical protein
MNRCNRSNQAKTRSVWNCWAQWAGLATFAVGCSSENQVFERTVFDEWTQAPTNEVDILWVVDDSQSMAEEQTAVANAFGSFIAQIDGTGADWHMAAISTSFDAGDPMRGRFLGEPAVLTPAVPEYTALFQSRVQVGASGSDFERSFEATDYALSGVMTNTYNKGFLRRDAYLMLVYLSDENDCSDEGGLGPDAKGEDCYGADAALVPVSEYVARFRKLKDDPSYVLVGAIVGPRRDSSDGCEQAVPGHRYFELADAMGGNLGNICEADYSPVLEVLGQHASGIRETFELTARPKLDTLKVEIDAGEGEIEVLEGETDGWTYDEATNYLTFHGAAIPPRSARIAATYTAVPGR